MGLLKGEDNVLYEGDYNTIKDKIFKRCTRQGVDTLELIDVYTLVKQLEVSFEDIDWLIEEGLCIEIPRAIKVRPNYGITTFPKASDLQTCKEFMNDKELFCKKYCEDLAYYDYDNNFRDYIDGSIMSCWLSLSPSMVLEYEEYKKEHKLHAKFTTDFYDLYNGSRVSVCGNQGTSALSNLAIKPVNDAFDAFNDYGWPIQYTGNMDLC